MYTLEKIRSLSDEELVRVYDNEANRTMAYADYFLHEIERREISRETQAMGRYTKWMTIMTVIILISTIVQTIVLFNH